MTRIETLLPIVTILVAAALWPARVAGQDDVLDAIDAEPIVPVGLASLEEACDDCDVDGCRIYGCPDGFPTHWFVDADLLMIRPYVTEPVAFLRGTDTGGTTSLTEKSYSFGHEPSFRVFGGRRFHNGHEWRVTYWHSRNDSGGAAGIPPRGGFAVDPFGNLAGRRTIRDPSDPRFGTIITGGDVVWTSATSETDVFDAEFTAPINPGASDVLLLWSTGVRIADLEQSFGSRIETTAGATFSQGRHTHGFLGAGPVVGLHLKRPAGKRFTLFGDVRGALLLGETDIETDVTVTTPAPRRFVESTSPTQAIPEFDVELGGAWKVNEFLSLTAGYQFQAWFGYGSSNGDFGGLYTGNDRSDVTFFDGLVLRLELRR